MPIDNVKKVAEVYLTNLPQLTCGGVTNNHPVFTRHLLGILVTVSISVP